MIAEFYIRWLDSGGDLVQEGKTPIEHQIPALVKINTQIPNDDRIRCSRHRREHTEYHRVIRTPVLNQNILLT